MAKQSVRRPAKKLENIRSLWADKTPETASIVEIDWVDITQYENWNTDQELELAAFTTLGYLLYEGKDPIDPTLKIMVLALTYEPKTRRWADYLMLPAAVIRETREIA